MAYVRIKFVHKKADPSGRPEPSTLLPQGLGFRVEGLGFRV